MILNFEKQQLKICIATWIFYCSLNGCNSAYLPRFKALSTPKKSLENLQSIMKILYLFRKP